MQGYRAGFLKRRGRAHRQEVVDFADGGSHFRSGNGPAHAPACDAVGLRKRIDSDGAVAHALERGHGNVLGAVVEHVLVDFIGNGVGIPADAEVPDGFELGALENLSRGIIRGVQDDGLRLRAERGGEFRRIEFPIGRIKIYEAGGGAGEDRVGPVVFVKRLEDHHLVAGIDDRQHRGNHCFGRAAADGDFALRIDGDALPALEFFGDGVAQGFRSPGDGVLIDVLGDGFLGGALDFLGRGKIGKTLREIDGAMLEREARHLANDGLGEPPGFFGDLRASAYGASRVCGIHLVVAPRRAGGKYPRCA